MALINTGRCHARQHKIKKGGMTMSQSKNVSGVSDGTPRIKLDKANFMTDSGKSVQIVAKASDLCEPIRWVSDNEAVATVDQTGVVTAHTHAIHRFTITARTSGDGAVIRIYQGKDDLPCEDLPVASVALPNTHDRYQSFTGPAVVPQCGTHSFYVVADAMAESGNVYVDSMCFEV